MRLHITTTKGVPGVRGTLVLDRGQRDYRAHYADVEKALYQGVAKAVQLSRGLWGVSIDGVDVEQGEVVDRLRAYLERFPDGVVGGVGGDDTADDDLIDRMVEMIEDGSSDELSDY